MITERLAELNAMAAEYPSYDYCLYLLACLLYALAYKFSITANRPTLAIITLCIFLFSIYETLSSITIPRHLFDNISFVFKLITIVLFIPPTSVVMLFIVIVNTVSVIDKRARPISVAVFTTIVCVHVILNAVLRYSV